MDWSTFWWIVALAVTWAIGKGVGRAQGKESAMAAGALRLTIEINGESVGGLEIVNLRPTLADPPTT
jgi:hypothetical protein